jgi:16S rRNA pseudouridine516 synthase
LSPERLWKRLKRAGFGTRSGIAALIDSGVVLLDGTPASPLARLSEGSVVTVNGRPVAAPGRLQTWLLNKPVGVDCRIAPDRPHSIAHLLATLPPGLFPVGRLDKDSCGLLLLTNDGKLCQRLMHPDFWHEKEYVVTVDKDFTERQIELLRSGTSYEVGPHRYQPRPCVATQSAPRELRITLTQGMHRQIRYMCRAAGLRVVGLQRIRLNQLLLGDLDPGAVRELGRDDLKRLVG